MNRDFIGALLQLNAEKNIPREQLVSTLAEAIQSAYRRATPGNENVFVDVDPESGRFNAYRAMHVVDEIEDEQTEYTVADAQKYDPNVRVGDLVRIAELDANSFGRIHAQLATQLVRQRLREVEREQVFGQYAQRESEIITGTVSRVEPRGVILDVGRAEAILPTTDQSASEHYRIGQHVKAYVLEVRRTTKGPLIYVSRTHKNFLRRMFELEVPEIHAGTVEIKAIAREAGSRSKVAVASRQEGLDPVGATVGQRGGRVQAVVAELGGEKIDIIPWNEDPAGFVANALSPATVVNVTIDEENRIASVTVPERMLSLAIGREGQNARLAAKLTGWRIDIRSDQAQPRPAAPEMSPAGGDVAPGTTEDARGTAAAEAVAGDGPPSESMDVAAQATSNDGVEADATKPGAGKEAAKKAAPKESTKAAATKTTKPATITVKTATKATPPATNTVKTATKATKPATKPARKSPAKTAARPTDAVEPVDAPAETAAAPTSARRTRKASAVATAEPGGGE